jgi:glyoxylase-like metal-dependent hydrolase (beta-lactamase superfamily II)
MRTLYRLLFLALFATSALAQQRDFSTVQITAQKVAGSVYMLVGAGGNIGASVGDDGIVIIDDQYAPLAPKIVDALKAISDKPIRFILNTHFHGDHTGGNEILGRTAPILAHTNVRKRLAAGGGSTPPAPKGALPVVTFDESLVVHVNGEDVRAVHYPNGHTDGDAVIFFTQSNVVHMGDDFFNGRFPFIDTASGGSVRGLIANVDAILAKVPDDVKIIPGHGDLADKAALQRYSAMLKESSALVSAGIKAGKSLDSMKADKVLAKWDSWSWQFINADTFLTTLHGELSKPAKKK